MTNAIKITSNEQNNQSYQCKAKQHGKPCAKPTDHRVEVNECLNELIFDKQCHISRSRQSSNEPVVEAI